MKQGIWIPINILQDDNLTNTEKIIFAEILQMTELDKGCFAGDGHFYKLIHGGDKVTHQQKKTINNHLLRLVQKGYIKRFTNNRNHSRNLSVSRSPQNVGPRPQNVDMEPTKCGQSKEKSKVKSKNKSKSISELRSERNLPAKKEQTLSTEKTTLGGASSASVIHLFKAVDPMYADNYKRKVEHTAANDLLEVFTFDQLKAIIEQVLPQVNADSYAKGKSVRPSELKKNMGYIKGRIDEQQINKLVNHKFNIEELN